MGGPITQYCGNCKKRKPIKGFDIKRGICANCKGTVVTSKDRKPAKKPTRLEPATPKARKCPNCLQRVSVDRAGSALVEHLNGRHQTCVGSGHKLPQRSRDALDYRLPGNFEGGGH